MKTVKLNARFAAGQFGALIVAATTELISMTFGPTENTTIA
jgi:hypothetical protein